MKYFSDTRPRGRQTVKITESTTEIQTFYNIMVLKREVKKTYQYLFCGHVDTQQINRRKYINNYPNRNVKISN